MTSIRKRFWPTPAGVKTAWLVDYRDQGGKRRSKQFARKKDAEFWAITAAAEVQQGVHTADSASITLQQAADYWLDGVRTNNREPTTIAAYEQHVRLHILPKLESRKLSQLTAPVVRRVVDEWLRDSSRAMATRVFRSLKAIISDAQERGYIAQNVAVAVKVKKAPREKGKATPPTKEELRKILKTAGETDDFKGRTIVELAIYTGMRASEIRGLPWRAIDLEGSTILVMQRAQAHGIIGPPKTAAGHRRIPIPEGLVATLRRWKVACPPHALDLAFPSVKGRVLSHGVMAKNHVKPILVAAGVTKDDDDAVAKYTAHKFRHAAASLWIEHGLNPKRVQTLVGHSSIQMTFDVYGHLFEQANTDASDANAIERALNSGAT